MSAAASSSSGRPAASGNRHSGGRRGIGRGRRGGGRGGAGRGGRRGEAPKEERLDDQMVDYWAKSDDPKLKERAEKERKERAEALKQQRQKKLDEDMQAYWKKQKTTEEEGDAKATEPST
jgi:hypothetical protein